MLDLTQETQTGKKPRENNRKIYMRERKKKMGEIYICSSTTLTLTVRKAREENLYFIPPENYDFNLLT